MLTSVSIEPETNYPFNIAIEIKCFVVIPVKQCMIAVERKKQIE